MHACIFLRVLARNFIQHIFPARTQAPNSPQSPRTLQAESLSCSQERDALQQELHNFLGCCEVGIMEDRREKKMYAGVEQLYHLL